MESIRANSEKDMAIKGYYDSLASKTRQESNIAKTFPAGEKQGDELVVMKPDEVVRHRPEDSSVTAGDHPFWMRQEVSPGVFLEMPRADNPSESLESGGAVAATLMNPNNWRTIKNRVKTNLRDLYEGTAIHIRQWLNRQKSSRYHPTYDQRR